MSLEYDEGFGSQCTWLPCSYFNRDTQKQLRFREGTKRTLNHFCRYVCAASWMGLRWPAPSSCSRAPCVRNCGGRVFCHSAHTRVCSSDNKHVFLQHTLMRTPGTHMFVGLQSTFLFTCNTRLCGTYTCAHLKQAFVFTRNTGADLDHTNMFNQNKLLR